MSEKSRKRIPAVFYCSSTGAEPVRSWIKKLSAQDRRVIGLDIATIEFGWPVGMPVCRPIVSRRGLWEVRSTFETKGTLVTRWTLPFIPQMRKMVASPVGPFGPWLS